MDLNSQWKGAEISSGHAKNMREGPDSSVPLHQTGLEEWGAKEAFGLVDKGRDNLDWGKSNSIRQTGGGSLTPEQQWVTKGTRIAG